MVYIDVATPDLDEPAEIPVTVSGWGDVVARSLLTFDFDFAKPDSFHGSVRSRTFADLDFISVACCSHAAYRDAAKIREGGRPEYLLTLQLAGEFRITQDDRTAVLKPGQFAIYDSVRPATVVSSDDYQSFCLKFPQELIGARGEQLSELTATRIDADSGLAPVVWSLLTKLDQTLDTALSANRYSTVRGVMDLVGTMLDGELRSRGLIPQVDSRRLLVERVHGYIEAHLWDPELGPQEVASVHFISLRYLHSVFQESGVTVGSWIRARRLDQCRRDLADPSQINVPVAAIAGRWGFKGASHFGQVFKGATGVTPADFRRAALEGR